MRFDIDLQRLAVLGAGELRKAFPALRAAQGAERHDLLANGPFAQTAPAVTSSAGLLAALAQTRGPASLLVIDCPVVLGLAPEQPLLQVSDLSTGVLELPLQGLLALSLVLDLHSQPLAILVLPPRRSLNGSPMRFLAILPLLYQLNVLPARKGDTLPGERRVCADDALCVKSPAGSPSTPHTVPQTKSGVQHHRLSRPRRGGFTGY